MRLRPILRPDLEARFRAKARYFEEHLGREFSVPAVCFHGTAKEVKRAYDFCFVLFVF